MKAFQAICEFLLIFKLKLNILGYNFILQSQNLRLKSLNERVAGRKKAMQAKGRICHKGTDG